MRLSIRHHTTYRYDKPAEYAAQILRLTPRCYEGLEIITWRLVTSGGGRLSSFEDGFGNASHMHTVAHLHDTVDVIVEGVVETTDTAGVVSGGYEPLPLGAWLRTTPMTLPSSDIENLAAAAEGTGSERLRRLTQLVRERADYQPGSTEVGTTAADALAGGRGVCQDHAHVFIAAARLLGIPARYVGGFHCIEELEDGARKDAGHAWAEAWDASRGWRAFDPANCIVPGERHVRTSIGLDYASASPVRGVRRRRGGTEAVESMSVNVQVARLAGQ